MRRLSYFLLAAMFGLLLTGKASAQRLDGTLRVTVTDGSQASIEDAKVTLTNEASGVSVDTRASSAGTAKSTSSGSGGPAALQPPAPPSRPTP